VHRVPYPPNRGDRIRSYHILKFLAERANVSLATLADEPLEPETTEELRSFCSQFAIEHVGPSRWLRGAISLASGKSATEGLFRSPKLARTVRQWSRETHWDAVVVFCSSMVQYLDVPELKDVPVVVDLVDVDSQKFFDYSVHARGIKKQLYKLEGRRLRRLECSLPDHAEAITLVSHTEADLYRSFCPNDRIHAVPNGVDLDYFRSENDGPNPWMPLPESDRTNLVFVGALDYQANIDGITWFVNSVWPHLREDASNLTLGLVGRQPVAEVRKLAERPGIRVFANVPDVRPYLAAADVAIAPLRIARGIQNKVLEAMAMAKPVVASEAAVEGLAPEVVQTISTASSSQSWTAIIGRLLSNRSLSREIGFQSREQVEQHYAWSAQLSRLGKLLPLSSRQRNCMNPAEAAA